MSKRYHMFLAQFLEKETLFQAMFVLFNTGNFEVVDLWKLLIFFTMNSTISKGFLWPYDMETVTN